MSKAPYLSINKSSQVEIERVKGSRFIASLFLIDDGVQAQAKIQQLRVQFADARHHCWAYRLLTQELTRFSDDGEPNGSAGKPILAPIVGHELFNVLIVVTRYFGGVKLGVGGLVRAYSQAANAVIAQAKIITITPKLKLQVTYCYEDTNNINTALAQLNLVFTTSDYGEKVCSDLWVTYPQLEQVKASLIEYTSGRVRISVVES